jgi:ABC-type transport system involved in multi-copper enzyme maturation permease subunit
MVLHQIWAITAYEFRMHWRRRGLLVVTLAMFAVMTLPALLTRSEMKSSAALGQAGVAAYTQNLIMFHWAVVGAILYAVMPFLFADAIPRDRQLGVSELLDTVPLPRYAYLFGKISGAWLGTLSSLLLLAVICNLLWWVFIAPFDLSAYLPIWLVGGLAMTLINIGVIVALTAIAPNSRIAILICIGFVVIMSLVLGFTPQGNWLDALHPLRPGIFYHFLPLPWDEPPQLLSLEVSILSGLLQVVVLSAGVLAWWRLRAER